MPTDTTPEAAKRQHEIFAAMSGDQKVRLAVEFSGAVRDIARAGFCSRHPSISEEKLRTLFFEHIYGIELVPGYRKGETMDETDFLKRLADKLSEAGIPFMLVGSVAASYHGHPRSTLDIDMVVDADEEMLRRFANELGESWYISEEAIREAVRNRTAFNIIDLVSGYKADLIVRKERPFSRTEFGRRIMVTILDKTLAMATPEDVILSKLEWSKLGSSDRQWDDALQVARTQGEKLDQAYIEKWAAELGVADLWKRIRDLLFPDRE
jgi:hypothetical protein